MPSTHGHRSGTMSGTHVPSWSWSALVNRAGHVGVNTVTQIRTLSFRQSWIVWNSGKCRPHAGELAGRRSRHRSLRDFCCAFPLYKLITPEMAPGAVWHGNFSGIMEKRLLSGPGCPAARQPHNSRLVVRCQLSLVGCRLPVVPVPPSSLIAHPSSCRSRTAHRPPPTAHCPPPYHPILWWSV